MPHSIHPMKVQRQNEASFTEISSPSREILYTAEKEFQWKYVVCGLGFRN